MTTTLPKLAEPFHVITGTLQLFIVARDGLSLSLHVAASSPEYDRDKPIGSEWERRVCAFAVEMLNAEYAAGRRDFSEQDVRNAIRQAEKAVPFAKGLAQ